jgi:hypothetical protein
MPARVVEHLNIVWTMITGDVGTVFVRTSAKLLRACLCPGP